MYEIMSIGVSGLLAASRALTATSHNVANVNTPGYSRQVADFVTRLPMRIGNNYLGNGVDVEQIRRNYDDFLTKDLREVTGQHSQVETLHTLSSQVDNLLADPDAGLSPALNDFFKAMQGVANDPSSGATRQNFLSNASSLEERFHLQAGELDSLSNQVNTQIQNQVDEVNAFASSIANFNKAIVIASSRDAGNGPPNDLLDSRDEAIRQLSEKVGVTVVKQDNGALNVFMGNGQSLVMGTESQSLLVVRGESDPTRLEIATPPFNRGTPANIISGQVNGGSLGGLLQFRQTILEPAKNGLGRIAIGIASEMNAQHKLGMTLENKLGGDLFQVPDPDVFSNAKNLGTLQVTAAVTNTSALTTSDYQLTVGFNGYQVTKLSDGTVTTVNDPTATSIDVDGLTLSIGSGVGKTGDSFLIRPTQNVAAHFSLLVNDPAKLAAASPLRSSVGTENTVKGKITTSVIDTTNAAFTTTPGALSPPLLIRFDDSPPAPGLSYSIYDNTDPASPVMLLGTDYTDPANPVQVNGGSIAYDPTVGGTVLPSTTPALDYGYQVSLSGAPKPGDSFTVGYNTSATGDNRNLLAMVSLQGKQTLASGTATFASAYGQMVAEVGVFTRRAEMNKGAEENLLIQAKNNQQEVAGVNLDEEAAMLLRYQESYQACAKVIAVTDTLFQSILGITGR
ncbi:flagellar hook-associated protein 1 FlgK [Gammaproteobacteria bacterium]